MLRQVPSDYVGANLLINKEIEIAREQRQYNFFPLDNFFAFIFSILQFKFKYVINLKQ